MSAEVRLTDKDWEVLLPGTEFILGVTKLMITPLGLEDTKVAVGLINSMTGALSERKITVENYEAIENILYIAQEVLGKAPELIAKSSGVHLDDVKKLPLAPAIALTTKVIEVNIESQDDLVGNLKALEEIVKGMKGKTGGSETSATS